MYVRRGVSGVVQDLAAAIARMEKVNPAYNNPGALIAAPGCTSVPGSIARCPTPEIGQADLERQVQLYSDRGLSISEMIGKWAPVCNLPICKGNDPGVYASNVGTWTGFDTSVPISQLSSSGASPEASDPVTLSAEPGFFSSFGDLDPMTVGIAAGLFVVAIIWSRA